MAGDPSRPHRRDAGLVALLALVLVAGLVYYGIRLSQDAQVEAPQADQVASATTPVPTQEPEPTDEPSTEPSVAPTVEPEPALRPGTCWDGTATTDLRDCGLPEGAAGLAWVFPSFAPDSPGCSVNTRTDRAFAVLTSYVCTEQVRGRQVLVAYDHVADIGQVDAVMHASVPPGAVTEIPGAHGGRCIAFDTRARPYRITGWYEGFPYVVSVFAPTASTADRAWAKLVVQRAPQAVRGQRA